jgi:hypothetical protein
MRNIETGLSRSAVPCWPLGGHLAHCPPSRGQLAQLQLNKHFVWLREAAQPFVGSRNVDIKSASLPRSHLNLIPSTFLCI